MEELLKGLGFSDDDIQKIVSGMKENKIFTTGLENVDVRYNKLKGQKEDLEAQITTATATIDDLKKNNGNNEELQSKIAEHEANIAKMKDEYETKVRNLSFDSAIEKALNGAKHTDLLMSKFDRSKLVLGDDGKVIGLDEQVSKLKETYSDLFEQKKPNYTPPGGGNPGEVTKESFKKMSYQDRVELYNTNKELYTELSKGD